MLNLEYLEKIKENTQVSHPEKLEKTDDIQA